MLFVVFSLAVSCTGGLLGWHPLVTLGAIIGPVVLTGVPALLRERRARSTGVAGDDDDDADDETTSIGSLATIAIAFVVGAAAGAAWAPFGGVVAAVLLGRMGVGAWLRRTFPRTATRADRVVGAVTDRF